jgi:hypothetical protein
MTALTLNSNTDLQNFKLLTDIVIDPIFLNLLNAENIKIDDPKDIFTDYKLITNLVKPVGNYSTNYSLNDRTFGTLLKTFKNYKALLDKDKPNDKKRIDFIEKLERDYLANTNFKITLAALNFSRNLGNNKIVDDIDRARTFFSAFADFLSVYRQSYKVEIYDLKAAKNLSEPKKQTKELLYEAGGVFIEVNKAADVGLAIAKAFNKLYYKNGLAGTDLEIARIELSSALIQGGATAFNLASGVMKTLDKYQTKYPSAFLKPVKSNAFNFAAEFNSVSGSLLNLGASAATIAVLVNYLNAAKTDQERNIYIAELSIQAAQLLVSGSEIAYALTQFARSAKFASSAAKGFGALTAVLTLSATVFEIINLAAEFDTATRTRNELSIYGSKYGFSGFNALANNLERTAITNAIFLAGQSVLAVVGIVGSFIPGVGFAIALGTALGSLVLAAIQQSFIEADVDTDRNSLLNQYGSWSNYWAQSYAALRARYEDSDGFRNMIREYQSMIGDDGYGRVVLLSSMTPNDVQFQIAGRLREGASLQNQFFDATVINKTGYTRNQTLMDATSGSIDLTSAYLRQYVSLGPVLISPSQISAIRSSNGKNSYITQITYKPKTWSVIDGNTSTTVDARGIALNDDGANTQFAADFNMGGGNDVIVVGVRKVQGDLGTGFNGIDYSNLSLALTVAFAEDGTVSINKRGSANILVEFIDSDTTSVGKRNETIQFLNTKIINKSINTTDIFKNVSYIEGSNADDTFTGNSKQNFFIASAGNDVYDGGGGGDWIDYSNNATSVKLALNVQLAHSYNLLKELPTSSNGLSKTVMPYEQNTNSIDNAYYWNNFNPDKSNYAVKAVDGNGITHVYNRSNGFVFGTVFLNKSVSLFIHYTPVNQPHELYYGNFPGAWVAVYGSKSIFAFNGQGWSDFKLTASDKLMVTNFWSKDESDFSVFRYGSRNTNNVYIFNFGVSDPFNFSTTSDFASFGDTDGNGKTEFITASSNDLSFTYASSSNRIMQNTWNTSEFNPHVTKIFTGDFNGDGKDDILRQEKGASAADNINMLSVYFSNGNYTFTKAETDANGNAKGIDPQWFHGDYTNLLVGDFNGDGFADIFRTEKGAYATNGEIHNIVNIWFGDGKGGFNKAPTDMYGNLLVYNGRVDNYTQTLSNIQNVRGSYASDTLVGDGQDNIIDGAGGSDKLYGLGGNDSFIAALSGNSFYDGGLGINFLDYGTLSSGANERISVSITAGHDGTVLKSADNYASRTDSFSLIQQIRGTDGNDTFMGGELDDQFFGQGGNDIFDTKAGDDIVVTGLGKDTVNLGLGNDKAYVQHDFVSSAGVPLQTDTVDSVIGKGRYVYILKNYGANSLLCLAELQVMSNGMNVAQGKSTNLKYSSQMDDKKGAALNLVDGNKGGDATTDGMFVGNTQGLIWIQVDLGTSTSIDAINIFGLTTGGAAYYQNGKYTVYVSDTDMAGKTDAELKAMANVGYYRQNGTDSYLAITGNLTTTSGTSANFFRRDLNAGEKTIDGGEGKDTVSYVQNGTGMTTDVGIDANLSNEAQQTVKTWFQNGWTNEGSVTDKLINIENIEGTQNSDRILGSSAANVLSGGDGNDWVNGGAGDDVIYTGTGKDVVLGGDGDDIISVQHTTKPTAQVGVGRYVYIRKNDGVTEHLSLAELQVMSNGVNVALGKTTNLKTSGQFDAGAHAAANLVDGKTGGDYQKDGIFASATQTNGWIQVDLGALTSIDAINVLGRTDGALWQNGQYTVYVSDTDMAGKTDAEVKAMANVGYVNVAKTAGWVTLQDPLKVTAGTASTFTQPDANKQTNALAATGRYVYIRKNDGVTDYLSLAELQVMSNGVNVALGKSTKLKTSGQFDDKKGAALNLVDGKNGGNYATDGIFASSTAGGGWIQVDLGASTSIDAINVFGRTDSSASQNGKYTVYVSDTDMAGKIDAEVKAMANVAYYNQSQVVTNTNILAAGMTLTTGTSSNLLTRYFISDAKNIDGGADNDVVSYKDSGPVGFGIDADLSQSRQTVKTAYVNGVANALSVTDTLISIEGIEGTDWNDKLLGSDQDNKLYGAGGSDWIDGGAGDDELITGTGADTVWGGSGDDVIRVQHTKPLVGVGRYVYIRKNDGVTEHLSLAELQVMSNGANVALGKTTNLKFSGQVDGHAAVNLVDGKTGGDYRKDGIFASSTRGGGWIQVDLGISRAIDSITVFGRTDTALEQNGRYTVYVSNEDMSDKTDAQLKAMANVGFYRENSTVSSSNLSVPLSATVGTSVNFFSQFSSSPDAKTIDGGEGSDTVSYKGMQDAAVMGITANLSTAQQTVGIWRDARNDTNSSASLVGTGRYVYIRKNDGVANYLSLAELQVMSNGVNVALGKTTNLKSSGQFDANKRAAINLVDGKTGGRLDADGIFASATTSGGWIQVDLGASTFIDAINIFGRTDSGSSQNGQYTVYVSDTDMAGKTDAQLKAMANVGYYRVDTQPTSLPLLNPLSVTNGTSMDFFFRDRVASSPTGGVVDNLSNIENIEGTEASDRLTGSDQNNKLYGLAGNDWIEGLDGSDYIETGTGFDKVVAGNGDDMIVVSHSRSKADWNLAATLSSTWSTLTGFGGVSDMDFLSSQFDLSRRNDLNFKGELLQELKADTGVRTVWIGYFQANTGSKTEGTTFAMKLSFRDKSGGGVEVSALGAKWIPIMVQNGQLDWETDPRTTTFTTSSVTGLSISALGFVDDYKIINGGEGTDMVSYAKTILPPNVGIWADLSTAQQTVKTWAQGGTFANGSVVDNLSSIEGIEGTDGNDYLKGNDKINRFSGGAGNDFIDAGAGADIIATGTGADTVLAGDGDDMIYVEHLRQLTTWTVSTALSSSTSTVVAPIGNVNDLFLSLGTYGFTADSKSFSNGRILLKDTSQSGKAVVWVGSYDASAQKTYAVQIEFSDKVGGGVNAKILSSKYVAGTEATGTSLDWNTGGTAPTTAYTVSSMSLSGMGYFNDAKNIAGGAGINTLDYSYSKTPRPADVGIFADLSKQKVDTWYQNATVMSGSIVDTLSGISNIGGTEAADKLMGNSAANEMAGYGGDDSLDGGGGNDKISTGTGVDTVIGGLGDDVIFVSHRRSVAKWDVNAFLSSSTSTSLTTYGFVKDINLTDSKFTLYGSKYGNQNAGVLQLDKSVYGQTTMWVGAFDGTFTLAVQIKLTDKLNSTGTSYVGGIDALVLAAKSTLGDVTKTAFDWDKLGNTQSIASASGQAGLNVSISNFVGASLFDDAKNLQGGDGVDTVNYRSFSNTDFVGVDANLSTTAQTVKTWFLQNASNTSSVTDTLSGFENFGGTDFADKITGSAVANKLWGYDGNDIINAGDGDDVVITGTGADTVDAGAGDDAIFVELSRPAAIAKGQYVLIRKEDGQGAFNLTGLQVKSNGVNVASGITLNSSAGNWYQVALTKSVAIDEITLTFAADQTNVSYKAYVSDADMKGISSVSDILKTANIAYSQLLTASSSSPTITTTFLNTPGSADSYPVASRFMGNKSINGGAGEDFLSYRQSEDNNPRPLNVGIDVNMTSGKVNTWFENATVNTSSAVDTISNIENIGGTQYADRLLGNTVANKLVGYEGNDTLDGGGAGDHLMGGEGSDTYIINASFGTDVIYEDKSNTGDSDQVIFNNISYADLWFQKSGANLKISQLGSTNVLDIRDWYSTDAQVSAHAKVELFKQGTFALTTRVESLVSVMAKYTKPSTTISGSTLTQSAKAEINTAIASAWQRVA